MKSDLDELEGLSSAKRALFALKQLKEKLEILEYSKSEPIAIIGLGCRFPGGANSPEAFWELLREGRDGITEIPPEHWNQSAYYDRDSARPGKIYTRHGGFVPHLQTFDANFFRISPREAMSLDPQQRLLLEVAWEALEYAGIAPEQLAGSQTGVFVGICGNDYWHRLLARHPNEIDAYMTTGNSHSLASGRLSYTLGLVGPSLSVNTACSSSLVAVHLAIASLRNQECNLALVGGVNRIFFPEISINFSKARMLSPDGYCKTFDASANGFVRAEGCGVVVLKRLKEAIASEDNILALLCGSAINQDGRTSGLTVPNGSSQRVVIEQALKNSQIKPEQVSYIEAHGTGTFLGDPIEVGALGQVFSLKGRENQPLFLGSVKANIGHLEAAAGIASLIKVVLSLQYETIPRQIHFQTPNPNIDWEQLPFTIPRQAVPWSRKKNDRVAGVSSFGFSGTNAHIVVAEAPLGSKNRQGVAVNHRQLYLFTLSAKSEVALKILVGQYSAYLLSHPHLSLADVCYTVNTGRSHFNVRLAILTSSLSQLQQQLSDLSSGQLTTGIYQGQVQGNLAPKVVFLFVEENQQTLDIGDYLYQTQSIFREAIDRCNKILSPFLDMPLSSLFSPQKELSPQLFTLTLFSLDYAIFTLWQSWGISPTAIVGYQLGEWVAGTVAEVFSLEDALKLLARQEKPDFIPCSLPKIPIMNNITGDFRGQDISTSQSWLSDRKSARYSDREGDMLKQKGYDFIIEIGNLTATPDEFWQSILSKLAQFYIRGVAIDWLSFEQNYPHHKVILPTYPFQRMRYWIEES